MELLRITEHIYAVPAQNNGMFPFAGSVYVDAERKILFDAGIGIKLLGAFLKEYQVDIVIVSHTHPDHIAGCGYLADLAPIFVPAEGASSFGNLDLLAERFIEGEEETELWKNLVRKVMGFRSAAGSRTFDAKSAFDLGSVKLLAMHTPGHVIDHYCFYEEHSGLMLLFDIDLSPMGPFYGHRESDVDQYEASVNFVRSFNPEVVVSSHMGVLRKNVDKTLGAFAARIPQRDDQIAEMLATPSSAAELAAQFPFMPKHHPQLRPLYLYWEHQMVKKHLDRLMERGEIAPAGDDRWQRGK